MAFGFKMLSVADEPGAAFSGGAGRQCKCVDDSAHLARQDGREDAAAHRCHIIVASLQRLRRISGAKARNGRACAAGLAWKWLDPSMPRHAFRRFLPHPRRFGTISTCPLQTLSFTQKRKMKPESLSMA